MFKFIKKKQNQPKDLSVVFEELKELKKDFNQLLAELDTLKKQNQLAVQKIGMVRFNPFKNVGGNQSFSIALLDGNDNGIVITCLYNRENNHLYAKPIQNKNSKYPLSKEEKEAIEKAQNQKK